MTYWDSLSRKTICTTVIESLQDQTRCRETGAANLEEWSGTVPGPLVENNIFQIYRFWFFLTIEYISLPARQNNWTQALFSPSIPCQVNYIRTLHEIWITIETQEKLARNYISGSRRQVFVPISPSKYISVFSARLRSQFSTGWTKSVSGVFVVASKYIPGMTNTKTKINRQDRDSGNYKDKDCDKYNYKDKDCSNVNVSTFSTGRRE